MSEIDDLRQQLADAGEREKKLKTALDVKSRKHGLYDRLDISVGTLDLLILSCIAAIAILVAVGVYLARS